MSKKTKQAQGEETRTDWDQIYSPEAIKEFEEFAMKWFDDLIAQADPDIRPIEPLEPKAKILDMNAYRKRSASKAKARKLS